MLSLEKIGRDTSSVSWSVHGVFLIRLTFSFFQLKWEAPNEEQLIKFLVEEKGFRLVMLRKDLLQL